MTADDFRSGRGLPLIVDKALRLLNLKQVIQEVETSVMSKVSCTACKAGNIPLKFFIIIFFVCIFCETIFSDLGLEISLS